MKRQQGFTLVELIIVIVLTGIIGGVLTMMVVPAIQSYLAVSQRATLTNLADTALRTVAVDVRRAVPNSLRLGDAQCLELVPTIDGGRFRSAPDAERPGAAYINEAEPGDAFDVLTPFTGAPEAGDVIVVGNRSQNDIYGQTNVAVVTGIGAPPDPKLGQARVQLDRQFQIPQGYDGARFSVVAAERQIVTYRCTAGLDAKTGSGSGTLVRLNGDSLGAAPACNGPVPAGAALVASHVESCNFVFYANAGATQDSGFVQMQLTLTNKGQSVPLTVGAHVSNVP